MLSKLPQTSGSGGGGGGGSSYAGLIQGQITVPAPVNGTEDVLTYSLFAGTVDGIYGVKTASGTLTLTIKINGTNVTGLTGLSITSTPANYTASGANTFAVGDTITFTFASVSTPVNFATTVKLTKS